MHLPMPQVSNSFFPFNPSLEEELKRLFANFTVVENKNCTPNVEDIMEEFRHNGRDFEYCPDAENCVPKRNTKRKKKKQQPTECVFCRNNGVEEKYYRQHVLKDADGRVVCPVLRAYTCPICGAYGDVAHTVKYCPKRWKNLFTTLHNATDTFKFLRNSTRKRRYK